MCQDCFENEISDWTEYITAKFEDNRFFEIQKSGDKTSGRTFTMKKIKMMNNTILITGAAGNLGGLLANFLKDRNLRLKAASKKQKNV